MGWLESYRNKYLDPSSHSPLRRDSSMFDPHNGMFSLRPFFEDFRDLPMHNNAFAPNVEISEKNGKVKVTAELAGLDEKDIDVSVEKDCLVISGEKKLEEERDQDGRHYSERSYGYFKRSIQLPYEVDLESINAKFKKGVLKVSLRQSEGDLNKSKKIPIL